MRKLICIFLFISGLSVNAQTVLFEEQFVSFIPSTWTVVDGDGLIPHSSVSQFTSAWIHVYISAEDSCAASTSYYDPSGQSADYLITPKLSLPTFSKLVWTARSYDASFPDSYLVLISSTDSLIGSFTDTLMFVDEENNNWQKRSVQLDLEAYANQDVYIAFKNITTDGYILMIGEVKLLGSDFAFVNEEETTSYSVYPNPCQDQITISNFQSGDLVSVYSIDGQLVLTSSESRIDVSSLNAGSYLLSVTSENSVETIKFIKQ